jgi:hypothetical protein
MCKICLPLVRRNLLIGSSLRNGLLILMGTCGGSLTDVVRRTTKRMGTCSPYWKVVRARERNLYSRQRVSFSKCSHQISANRVVPEKCVRLTTYSVMSKHIPSLFTFTSCYYCVHEDRTWYVSSSEWSVSLRFYAYQPSPTPLAANEPPLFS